MGLNTVTSMDINYAIDGGTAVTESVSGLNLGTGDIHPFNHSTSWSPTAAKPMILPCGLAILIQQTHE